VFFFLLRIKYLFIPDDCRRAHNSPCHGVVMLPFFIIFCMSAMHKKKLAEHMLALFQAACIENKGEA
jgi:hypothetical protein